MRLPVTSDSKIDRPEAIKMMRYAIDNGVNYFDTAYGYHGGQSEVVTGEALLDGYRQKVKLATKFPSWNVKSRDDFDRVLNDQLKKMQVDHIDYYLIHSLGDGSWKNVQKFDVLTQAEKALKAGKIGHLGFSFHDDAPVFLKIIKEYKFEFCQIQINYLDENNQAGLAGLKAAAAKGMAVIAMEPLLGGKLARLPGRVQTAFDASGVKKSQAEWALNYLWDMPEISTVLSGMSTMRQVEDNLVYAGRSSAGMLTGIEKEAIKKVQKIMLEDKAVPCTSCKYCAPCPNGVDIPRNFEIYNDWRTFENDKDAVDSYAWFKKQSKGKETADNCNGCRTCEEKCPQKIVISEWMPKIKAALDK